MSTAEPAVVRMGHDLVRNLGHLPPETATMEIATHIRKFWEPRMRHELLARVRWGDTTLHPLLVATTPNGQGFRATMTNCSHSESGTRNSNHLMSTNIRRFR